MILTLPHRLLATIVAIAASTMAATAVYGQSENDTYKFDIGVGAGMSGYLGDANESNIFASPGVAIDVAFRYLFDDSRWAIRGQLTALSLSGNTEKFDNVYPLNVNYKFSAWAYDLGARGEFNFFAYGFGETYKRLRRWTPYLSLGIGATYSKCGDKSAMAFNIPMGFGVKYKASKRVNLMLEFTMTKVFGDHVDGELKDLYMIKSSFIKNTDWYSSLMVGVSYEFGPRCSTCHRID